MVRGNPPLMSKAWLLLSLLSTAATACAVDPADEAGDDGLPYDDSKADGLEAAPAAWHWANETPAEFEAHAPQHLAFDHAMAKRLQFWVDAADAALRAKYPTRLKNVPKPQIFIDTSDADGFLFGS